ncbi:MAG TPA: VCBS repeat-containing protein [Myxococcota bacterium]|nr:VCBS repeat-containing protein [Myxococcota bacterium]
MRALLLGLLASSAVAAEPRTVVFDGEAVACLVGGKGTDGAGCPDASVGVSVAPIADGAASLSVGPLTLLAGNAEEVCGHNRKVGAFDAKPLPQTRKITMMPLTSGTYVKLVGEAVGVPSPKLTQLFKVDLDGDGKDEVVFAADSGDLIYDEAGNATSYAFVGVRRIGADGQVKTHLIFQHKEAWTAAQINDGSVFVAHRFGKVLGLTDIDGDGKAELVVEDGFYEGFSRTVYRVGEKIEALGAMGCGA